MRRRAFLVACLLAVAASLPRAQTTTADGVDAFVRGDYQRAVDILKPIAERSPQHDHTAEFFMAAMYANGLGVPLDAVRACALYIRASGNRTGPFEKQADALVRWLRELLGKDKFEDCRMFSSMGFDHRFQPETFLLEPGHSIAWDLKGATITYAGKDKRVDMRPLARDGAVFLPLQHTELAVGPIRSTRRHFIEIFMWSPSKDWQQWTLGWRLFEVVRDELITIASEDTLTISAPEPPTQPSWDAHELASVQVNDHGDAEWAVRVGPHPRTEVIEPDAERQEARQLTLARRAADARVDWTRVRDIYRAPALTYTDANGCENAFVYGWSDDRTEAIAVRADRDLLQLSTTAKTFDVATQRSGLEIVLHLYQRPLRDWPFCTDVGRPAMPEETWRATRGTVTVELSAPGVRARAPFLYRATIRIVGAEFINGSGVRVQSVQPITLTALVGGFAG
jgi:hypothetical protein